MKNIRSGVIRGLAWSSTGQIATQAISFAMAILLSRILGPSIIGLVGMVMVFIGFIAIFSELGFSISIIQSKKIDDDQLSTLFWLSVTLGSFFGAAFLASGPLIAGFYENDRLIPIASLLSIKFLLGSTTIVHRSLLIKRMDFKRIAIIDLISIIVSSCTGLYCALNDYKEFSIVIQQLVMSIIGTLGIWIASSWRPVFVLKFSKCRELIRLGLFSFGSNIVHYLSNNCANLLIGRVLGSIELAFYSRGHSLVLYPTSKLSEIISKVMFPTLSQISEDPSRLRAVYLKTLSVITLVSFPCLAGIYGVSTELVTVLLGEKWIDSIPLIKIFSMIGVLQCINSTYGWLYVSKKRNDIQFKIGLTRLALLSTGILIAIQWGLVQTAYTILVIQLAIWIPISKIACAIIDLPIFDLFRAIRAHLVISIIMAILIQSAGSIISVEIDPIGLLIIKIIGGATFYTLIIRSLKTTGWLEIERYILKRA